MEKIREWFIEGVNRGAEYLVIAYDDYYQEDRPIFIFPEQDVQKKVIALIAKGVQHVPILSLKRDIEEQIFMATLPVARAISNIVN